MWLLLSLFLYLKLGAAYIPLPSSYHASHFQAKISQRQYFVGLSTERYVRSSTILTSIKNDDNDELTIDESSTLSSTPTTIEATGDDKQTVLSPLEKLLHPSENCNVDQVSPTTLAYIGDSVFELFIRSRYVWPTRRTTDLQQKVVGLVRGKCFFLRNFFYTSI